MKIGLQIPDFTWPGGPSTLGADLASVARTADDAGFDAVAVMDHVFQIGPVGPIENDMLEGYTTLGFLAAHTSRARLFTLVTGVTYRDPGLLAKIVTTLDVLSGGRAWLGVGAAWNDEESRGLGLSFPPTAERFERLEETLQICLQMWSGDESAYDGKHYRLGRTLNSPQALTRPHPPFEKTVILRFDADEPQQLVDQLGGLAELGIQTVIGGVADVWRLTPLEVIGRDVIPAVADL